MAKSGAPAGARYLSCGLAAVFFAQNQRRRISMIRARLGFSWLRKLHKRPPEAEAASLNWQLTGADRLAAISGSRNVLLLVCWSDVLLSLSLASCRERAAKTSCSLLVA